MIMGGRVYFSCWHTTREGDITGKLLAALGWIGKWLLSLFGSLLLMLSSFVWISMAPRLNTFWQLLESYKFINVLVRSQDSPYLKTIKTAAAM